MIKKLMLTLCAVALAGYAVKAQTGRSCATSEFHKAQLALHPEIAIQEASLNAEIDRYISGKMAASSSTAKTAFDPNDDIKPWTQDVTEYHIPIVFHIIYDFTGAAANVTDDQIYNLVGRINQHYNATDPKLSAIINPFKPYIGNAHVTFHLANKDPNGKPTRGIVREYAYATNGGDESAKIGQWPPNQYLNVYLENVIGRGAGKGIVQAYATFPTDYGTNPYSQGVISRADQVNYPPTFGDEYTITHEIGHFLYLYHPWNNNGREVEDTLCGDDEVDDTPPTVGHFSCGTAKLYDTMCATGYFRDYDSVEYFHRFELLGNISSNPSSNSSVTYTSDSLNFIGQSFKPDTTDYLTSIKVRVGAASRSGDITSLNVYRTNGTLLASSLPTNNQLVTAGQILTYSFAGLSSPLLLKDTSYKFVINRVSGGLGLFSLDVNDSNKYAGGTLYKGSTSTANNAVSGIDLYFAVTGTVRDVAANTTSNKVVWYNSTYPGPNVIGQSIVMGTAGLAIRSISVRANASSLTGDSTSMSIYNMAGGFMATSDTQKVTAGQVLTYNFRLPVLTAYTTYKFVINTTKGAGVFSLDVNNSNPYAGGMMYNGSGALNAVPGSDLYFTVDVTRLRRVDYPDTTNTQNIMDYSGCPQEMFSKAQVARMRTALRSDVGNRSNLIDTANLIRTGVMDAAGNFIPPSDITPTALYTVSRPFTCDNSNVGITFVNRSYNDTIATADWTFDKTPNTSSNNVASVNNTFTEPGWVTASLTVTGNNSPGSSTYTRNDLVYVADHNPIDPLHIEDFNPSDLLDHYPIFNYFMNPSYKWELSNNAGFYDKTSMKFANYDPRDQAAVTSGQAVNTATQSPRGLYADFYTPAYDLTGFGGNCFLDFYSAGAYRTTKTSYMNDTLLISYTTNCGVTWSKLGTLTRGDLANNGYHPEAYEPTYMGEWKEQSFSIPAIARADQMYFRMRYLPGTDNAYLRYSGLDFGTGNNFYLDRLAVTANPLGVQNGVIVKLGMSIMPNPTSGAATIRLNGGDNSTADVNVTDVTGKLVYHTSVTRKTATTEIEIPASVLHVKGMYLVHVVTNGATETQKLVAY